MTSSRRSCRRDSNGATVGDRAGPATSGSRSVRPISSWALRSSFSAGSSRGSRMRGTQPRQRCDACYADDCNVCVQSKASAERVMASLERCLNKRVRVTVNRDKSAVRCLNRPQRPPQSQPGPVWE
jgi:hypothetical protein